MVNLDKVVKVHVRLEGEVNREWAVHFEDGSVQGFYALESSAEYEDGPHADEKVAKYEPELTRFLDEISEFLPNFITDMSKTVLEYDYDPKRCLVSNIEYEVATITAGGMEFAGNLTKVDTRYYWRLGCIDTAELVNGELILKGREEWDAQKIVREAGRRWPRLCQEFVNKRSNNTFEWENAPLDGWWGFGSIFLAEEGIKVKVEWNDIWFTVKLS